MKSAVLQKNGVIDTIVQPVPEIKPDECLVRIKACGICSSDVARAFDGGAYHYPLVMGHEMAGEVHAVGAAVRNWKKGDRAAIFPLIPCGACGPCREKNFRLCEKYDYFGSRRNGGLSEFLAVNPWNLLRIPADISDEQAALVEPIAVALHALKLGGLVADGARPRSARSAVILGGGFLGQVAARILMLADANARPLIVDRNPFKMDLARAAGLDALVLADDAAWNDFVKTRSSAFPFVLEASGSPQTYGHSITLAGRRGTVVWMGNISGDLTIPKAAVSSILRKELRVLGTWNSDYQPASAPSDWTEAIRLLQSGLDVKPLVTHRVSLAEFPELMQNLYRHRTGEKRVSVIKVVVNV